MSKRKLPVTTQSASKAKKPKPRVKKTTSTTRKSTKVTSKATNVAQKGTDPMRKRPSKTAPSNNQLAEVALPASVSLRAVEKKNVLEREFDHYFRKSMYQIAYVSGFCFLLIGATLATKGVFFDTADGNGKLPALAIESVEPKDKERSTEEIKIAQNEPTKVETLENQTVTAPTFKLLSTDSFPSKTREPFTISFSATDYKDIVVKVKPAEQAGFLPDPNITQRSDGTFVTTIPTDTYPAGNYMVVFLVQSPYGVLHNKQFRSPIFTVPTPENATETELVEDEVKLTEVVTEPVVVNDPSTTPSDRTGDVFAIFAPQPTLSGMARVGISLPEGYSDPALYRTRLDGSEHMITNASLYQGQSLFIFDSSTLPNGTFSFYASAKTQAGTVTSRRLQLTVSNQQTRQSQISPTLIEDDAEREAVRRSLAPISTTRAPLESEVTTPIIQAEDMSDAQIDTIFAESRATLETHFKNYTEALRAGDTEAIARAEGAIDATRADLTSAAEGSVAESSIQDRIEQIKRRKLQFESLRQAQAQTPESTDTDGDGILDRDERLLYNTDPNSSDTDGDGISDSDELASGRDPLNGEASAVIEFESPRDSIGLSVPDTLVITSVAPLVSISTSSETNMRPPVSTVITGTGLPNSFVTLYIFSTPVVVSIKTDADGSFEYTLDAELEDGSHDVYVAVTDHTGDIVAHSNPFSFVKQAEAFTPVDASESTIISEDTIIEKSGTGYTIAIGVSVISFGLILLMLGIGLRSKEELETLTGTLQTTSESDMQTKNPTI